MYSDVENLEESRKDAVVVVKACVKYLENYTHENSLT